MTILADTTFYSWLNHTLCYYSFLNVVFYYYFGLLLRLGAKNHAEIVCSELFFSKAVRLTKMAQLKKKLKKIRCRI